MGRGGVGRGEMGRGWDGKGMGRGGVGRDGDGKGWGLPFTGNSSRTHMGMALARDGDGTIVSPGHWDQGGDGTEAPPPGPPMPPHHVPPIPPLQACGPGLTRECDRNVLSSGLCLRLDPQLRPRQLLAPGYQGCLQGLVDLVFLFDGSNSMSPEQFGAIRDFMVDVMEKLENTSIHFGAVQFSTEVQPQFTLADYAARPRPRELLRGLRQLGHLTDTFSAIAYVTRRIFTPAGGARAGARRVLIIVTDGDATDEDQGSVREVGNNFNSPDTRLYLSQFASRPSTEFVKVLDSFEKLRGLFHDLQAKIYDIEGTSDHNRFHLELCSSGMSIAVVHGRRVTGAVGADNWAGGLVELEQDTKNETFVGSPTLEENVTDTYLGYAVTGLRVPGRALVAAGAPRHLHVGAIVLFEVLPEAAGSWRVLQTLPGEQVGSYFGATLCALEQGGETVALLVGAPNHFDGRRGGRVQLYRWQEEALQVAEELWGAAGHPLGRFGASLSILGDLDGDELPEAAVGAPMEDEERGAVYIFSGRPGGLQSLYSQRLEGQEVAPGLRFFGQALAGGTDLSGDGLRDLAVGTGGHVVVLRWGHGVGGGGRGMGHGGDGGWAGWGAGDGGDGGLGDGRWGGWGDGGQRMGGMGGRGMGGWRIGGWEMGGMGDEVCESDLGVRALPGGAALLGVPGAEFGVRLVVGNAGEDAYGAALQVQLPAGLSFRRAQATRVSVGHPTWDPIKGYGGTRGFLWGIAPHRSLPHISP
uniref:VWFA domain-containing protein n=1 Tax=Strigops habroptila TaxID=2489341 RepID=A0A672U8T3_STRHB